MNELKKNWFPIVCFILMLFACILSTWAMVLNSQHAAEIKDLKSEIAQAYFIEEGTVVSASEGRQILVVKLDRGDTVSAEVLLTEVKAGCNAYQWSLEGVRVAILRNKAENEYVVLTVFGREQNVNTLVY